MVNNGSILPKLAQPVVSPDTIERPRLFECLDRSLAKFPAIWVSSPPGSGKTTLLNSYLRQTGECCLWYRLGSEDSDIAEFFQYLGIAAGAVTDTNAPPLPSLTPEYCLGIPVFAHRYFESLYKRFNNRPFSIVLDNYQELNDTALHDLLADAIEALPENGHILIASRQPPPASFARLQVNGLLAVLDWADVRFFDEECECLLRKKGVKNTDYMHFIKEKARGWVAGMVLMASSRKRSEADYPDMDGNDHQLMFGYFAAEILKSLPEKETDILLKSAFLPDMPVNTVAELGGYRVDEVSAVLEKLHQKNCFVECRARSQVVYQYHPLFRDFLLAQHRKYFSNDEIKRLKKHAAELLITDKEYDVAVELLIELREFRKLASLCIGQAPTMLAAGRNQALLDWASHIPQSIQDQYPWLLYWYAAALSIYDHLKARAVFRRAISVFGEENNIEGQYLSWAGAAETYAVAWDEFKSCESLFEELHELRQRHPEYPSLDVEARVLCGILACRHWRNGVHREFPGLLDRCMELLGRLENPNQTITMGFSLSWLYLYFGDSSPVISIVDTVGRILDDERVTPVALIQWHSICAAYKSRCGLPAEEVAESIGDARSIAKTYGIRVLDDLISGVACYHYLMIADMDAAEREINMLHRSLMPNRRLARTYYLIFQGWYVLQKGLHSEALGYLMQGVQLARDAGCAVLEGFYHFHISLIHIRQSDRARAEDNLTGLKAAYTATESQRIKSQLLMSEAYFALQFEPEGRQKKALAAMLAFMRVKCYKNVYGRIDWMLERLYAKALFYGIETEYVGEMIRSQNIRPGKCGRMLRQWPYPVEIRAMGDFSVWVNGERLAAKSKSQNIPLKLLKILVGFRVQGGVGMETLSEMLWPDADGDIAFHNLETAVYRLRKLLKYKKVITQKEGKLYLNTDYCRSDLDLLSWCLECADHSKDDTALLEALADQVLQVCERPFLSEEASCPVYMIVSDKVEAYLSEKLRQFRSVLARSGLDGYAERVGSIRLVEAPALQAG